LLPRPLQIVLAPRPLFPTLLTHNCLLRKKRGTTFFIRGPMPRISTRTSLLLHVPQALPFAPPSPPRISRPNRRSYFVLLRCSRPLLWVRLVRDILSFSLQSCRFVFLSLLPPIVPLDSPLFRPLSPFSVYFFSPSFLVKKDPEWRAVQSRPLESV